MALSIAVKGLRNQQAALAAFGSFALRENNLQKVLAEAARVCAMGVSIPRAKIYQYRADQQDLCVVASHGWQPDVVGYAVSTTDVNLPQCKTFLTGEPVVLEDVSADCDYMHPTIYADHEILATASVPIKGEDRSWGVLAVDSLMKLKFRECDIVFLTAFANVIAEAAIGSARSAQMHRAIGDLKSTILEKDALLAERAAQDFRLRELQIELLHVSRLSAMGQMTAAIAHELNQPLAAISNYLGAVRRTLHADESGSAVLIRANELLDKVQNQTLRAGDVIRNMKEIIEKRDGRRVAENIGTTIKDALALIMFGAAHESVSVELDLESDTPPVLIDRVQIQQILINLIRNSIESMSRRDQRILTLSTGIGEPGFVEITVQDTGCGVPPSVSERLFQPFNTSKSGGMGLGLMICQTLVEANGGRIWRVNNTPTGSAFRFSVPVAPPVSPAASVTLSRRAPAVRI